MTHSIRHRFTRHAACFTAAVGLSLGAAVPVHAGFITFLEDRPAWEAAVVNFKTIDFTGFADNSVITDQYADQGVLFTDGNDRIRLSDTLFLVDGAGLRGGISDDIVIEFATPITAIAVDFPGVINVSLFSEGQLIHQSADSGGGGAGHFLGIVASSSFDRVVFRDPIVQQISIDNFSFVVPASPAWVVVLFALGTGQPRRRACALQPHLL